VDRLELALYSMHHRLLEGHTQPSSEAAEAPNGESSVAENGGPPPEQASAASAAGKDEPA